jgi:predicted metal-dependent RNase
LFDYVKKVNPEHVYCLHGEKEVCQNFARELQEMGFDAHAPEEGQNIEV